MSDFDPVTILVIFLFFGLPWIVIYLQSRCLAAVEVELRELSTLLKSHRIVPDRGGSNA